MEKTFENKKRNGNIELLRIICMCMIIVLHALYRGELLVNVYTGHGVNSYIAWLLESFSTCAVNTFMLISGYYMSCSKFKLDRLIELIVMTEMYSLVSMLICLSLGIDSLVGIGFKDLMSYFFPIHNKLYWFMAVYILIYVFSPLINRGIENLNQKQYKFIIVFAVVSECLLKSVLPARFVSDDKGFGVVWFLIIYLIGAYIRKYGFKFFNTKIKGIIIYIVSSILIFTEELIIQYVNERYGHMLYASEISLDYNHIFVLMASLGLFSYWMNKKTMNERISKVVCFLSPMTLGVYLVHENMSLRSQWQKWFGLTGTLGINPALFILKLLIAVVVVFTAGMIIDYLRILLFSFVKRGLAETRIGVWIRNVNDEMNAK